MKAPQGQDMSNETQGQTEGMHGLDDLNWDDLDWASFLNEPYPADLGSFWDRFEDQEPSTPWSSLDHFGDDSRTVSHDCSDTLSGNNVSSSSDKAVFPFDHSSSTSAGPTSIRSDGSPTADDAAAATGHDTPRREEIPSRPEQSSVELLSNADGCQSITKQRENVVETRRTVIPSVLVRAPEGETETPGSSPPQVEQSLDNAACLASTQHDFPGVPILPKPTDGCQISESGSHHDVGGAPLATSIQTTGQQRGPVSFPTVLEPRPKRKRNNEAGRRKIKQVRRSGACIRCRLYNESCDENTPCARCVAVTNTARLFRQPCFREKLDNIIAFRAGNARAGKVRSEPMTPCWSSEDCEVKVIDLYYPFEKLSLQSEESVRISCRKFLPYKSDVLAEPWNTRDGDTITLHSTPYACYDSEEAVSALGQYISNHKFALLRDSMHDISDDILKCTHDEALRYAAKLQDSAVSLALNIRATSFFSRTRMVTSTNQLGLPYFCDDRVRVNGRVPIPAVLDYQIDYMAIQYMLNQMKQIVRRLKDIAFGRKKYRNWYEFYLTSFLLLSSLEVVHARQLQILRRFEERGETLQTQVRHTSERMMQEWEYSAKVLIYHYRAILKGMVPFASAWDEKRKREMKLHAGIDDDALEYMCRLSTMIQARGDELRRAGMQDLDNKEAKPWVWLSQLIVDDEE